MKADDADSGGERHIQGRTTIDRAFILATDMTVAHSHQMTLKFTYDKYGVCVSNEKKKKIETLFYIFCHFHVIFRSFNIHVFELVLNCADLCHC